MAKALWRALLRERRSEGVGEEEDERGWRSIMGSEEKEVVMMGVSMAERYLYSCLFVKTRILSRANTCFIQVPAITV